MTELIVAQRDEVWGRLKAMVLDSVSFPITRRVYNMALDEFPAWWNTQLPNRKMRNVLDELPREQHAPVVNVMRAAWRLTDFDEGLKRIEGLARFLEHDYESAARSLREGMAEMFTIQKLKLPPSLYKCLGTTNVIESPQSRGQKRTSNVTRRRDGAMVERWLASAWLLTAWRPRKRHLTVLLSVFV
jgi:hypothetical protein